jgi:hypothetical protein
LVAYCLVFIAIAVWAWRQMSLRELPDFGEPFDVEALGTVSVPDDQNAYLMYREAVRELRQADSGIVRPNARARGVTDWSRANADLKRWVMVNRGVLDSWLRGTERREYVSTQPKDMRIDTPIDVVQEQRTLVPLALLEGSRREQAGDLEGAWTMYRAALRCSQHSGMHGPVVARIVGSVLLGKTKPHVAHWVEHPAMTITSLRQAQQDLEVCAAMTPPVSQAIQVEYFATNSALSHPENWERWGIEVHDPRVWYNQFPLIVLGKQFLRHEPERSRRVLRLMVANVLSQCDRPPSQRAKLQDATFLVHAANESTPPAVRALGPEGLQRWLQSSDLIALYPEFGSVFSRHDSALAAFDVLRLVMAVRAYGLERGANPKTYRDLLGAYLKTLPEGFEPGDPVVPSRP